jgi:hypothetical protein
MSSGRRVEIRRQKRLFNDFFKIDELIVSAAPPSAFLSIGRG